MSLEGIIHKECMNTSEVYLYKEDDKWYAYYHSAEKIKQPEYEDCVLNEYKISLFGVLLNKIEVDLQGLIDRHWRVELCSDDEIILV